MIYFGLHLIDWLICAAYLIAMVVIGVIKARRVRAESDFFLAGRKLGYWVQFFLNFGQMTDPTGAARTSSVVFNNGVGGVWISFQTLFMTPYYWFMNAWFRRARLTTVADLFSDRFGGKSLAFLYALFGIFFSTVSVGATYLVAFKMVEAIVVKSPSDYTPADQRAVADFKEYSKLEKEYKQGHLSPESADRHAYLQKLHARGELKSFVSYIKPLPFYLVFTMIVASYILFGGMAALAATSAYQGLLVVIFSLVLIPFGISRLGGLGEFHRQLPDRMVELFGSGGSSEFTWYSIAAIYLISMVSIHSIPGNMATAGSARTEEAASFGAVSGGFLKRWMIIAWCFCGLIAYALFGGSAELSDPDLVWGTLCRTLLASGFLGLILVGILAGDMADASGQCLFLSAMGVRNIYQAKYPHKSDQECLLVGRILILAALVIGIGVALLLKEFIAFLKLALTFQVTFGAVIFVVFKWRRVTKAAALTAVICSLIVIVIVPVCVPLIPGLNTHPALQQMTREQRHAVTVAATSEDVASGLARAMGEKVERTEVIPPKPIFFERIVSLDPSDPAALQRGEGRFHLELYLISLCGLDLSGFRSAHLLTFYYLFDICLPFALIFGISLVTRDSDPARAARFYAKMRTLVVEDPEEDSRNLQRNMDTPAESETRKLFPGSAWEFQRWTKRDWVAFPACCLFSVFILCVFAFLLNFGRS